MFCHLPIPYVDELLYSDIARYIIRIGATNTSNVGASVFGRKIKPNVDLPSSLETISQRTWRTWHMSGEDVANQLTLFPYYSRYVPRERAEKCLAILRSDNGGGVHSRLGVNGCRVKAPPFLRFCKACREEDLSKYGETYWRRSHQLTGVLVCPDHGQQLIDSSASMRPRRFSQYADATLSTANASMLNDDRLSKNEAAIALKVAKRSQEMLFGPIIRWPAENAKAAYRQAAIERGFSDKFLTFSPSKLEASFVSFYGEDLLARLGCEVQKSVRYSWIQRIFQRNLDEICHPVQHALVQIFLESVPANPWKNPFGNGPWKCPNPYALHKEPFPITKIKIYISRKGQRQPVATAKCSCGFSFTFLRTNNDDPNVPVVNIRHMLGPTWVAEAERLKKDGFTMTAIGTKMGIDFYMVKRLLEKKPISHRASPEEIAVWREEWLRLLDNVPNRSYDMARRKKPRIYKRLRLYDAEWFNSLPRNQHSQSRNKLTQYKNQVDWAQRDAEWSQRLSAAADKIRDRISLERVTINAMISQAGLSTSVFSYMNRLPACRVALRECSESREAFRKRRIQAALAVGK